jgi:hypothetical protein
MIVVLGSRHDPVAAALVDAWPTAALCSADDLTRPGWAWSSGPRGANKWVVDGTIVDDERVAGVFVRRSTVYPEELVGTHAGDRSYLAAETHAFLVFVLAATGAIVVNRGADGSLGDEDLRPERWMQAAADVGLAVAPLRLSNAPVRPRRLTTTMVEVVGGEVVGDAPARSARLVVALAEVLDLRWATMVFDGRHRLVAVTSAQSPGAEATAALGRLLATGASP